MKVGEKSRKGETSSPGRLGCLSDLKKAFLKSLNLGKTTPGRAEKRLTHAPIAYGDNFQEF